MGKSKPFLNFHYTSQRRSSKKMVDNLPHQNLSSVQESEPFVGEKSEELFSYAEIFLVC